MSIYEYECERCSLRFELKRRFGEDIISMGNGVLVWSEPKSAVEGAEVIDKIREPIEVTVLKVLRG